MATLQLATPLDKTYKSAGTAKQYLRRKLPKNAENINYTVNALDGGKFTARCTYNLADKQSTPKTPVAVPPPLSAGLKLPEVAKKVKKEPAAVIHGKAFRSTEGAVYAVWSYLAKHYTPTTRKESIEALVGMGINIHTVQTQYQRYRAAIGDLQPRKH